jgi:microcystin-dependent protein
MPTYFTPTPLTRNTLARADAVNSLFQGIQAGFALLPDPEVLAQNRVTFLNTAGPANAYTATMAPAITSYVAGLSLVLVINTANTGASTLNVNGLGARAITRPDGANVIAGELTAGGLISVTYNGTQFIVLSQSQIYLQLAAASAAASQSSAEASQTSRLASETARDLAQQWAAEAEDVEVAPGLFSALNYAAKAAQSAASVDAADLLLRDRQAGFGVAVPTASTDFRSITQGGVYTLNGFYTNGPLAGGASAFYAGTLVIMEADIVTGARLTQIAYLPGGSIWSTTASGTGPISWTVWDRFLKTSDVLVPAGATMQFAMDTAPIGWIKANGDAVSRTVYSALFSAIGTVWGAGNGTTTFNLPDLRGEFGRGWDDGRGVDTGRVFGSSQLDQMQRITGTIPGTRTVSVGTGTGALESSYQSGATGTAANGGGTSSDGTLRFDSADSPDARVSTNTDGETRSRNVALLWCIKL